MNLIFLFNLNKYKILLIMIGMHQFNSELIR